MYFICHKEERAPESEENSLHEVCIQNRAKLLLDVFGRNGMFLLTKALIQKRDPLMQSKAPSSKHWVINKYIIVTEEPRETSANSHGKLNPFLENMSFQLTNTIGKQKCSV